MWCLTNKNNVVNPYPKQPIPKSTQFFMGGINVYKQSPNGSCIWHGFPTLVDFTLRKWRKTNSFIRYVRGFFEGFCSWETIEIDRTRSMIWGCSRKWDLHGFTVSDGHEIWESGEQIWPSKTQTATSVLRRAVFVEPLLQSVQPRAMQYVDVMYSQELHLIYQYIRIANGTQ